MDELRLNTVHRFRKRSPRVLMEEHGSCEVPAGCGGVVLRWLNPNQGCYVLFTLFTSGKARLFVDGERVHSSLRSLPLGEHVLALHLTGAAWFVLAVEKHQKPHQQRFLVSAGGQGWRASPDEPPDPWKLADFEPPWQELAEFDCPKEHRERWDFARATKLGARPLGLAGEGPLWVRKRFQLTP